MIDLSAFGPSVQSRPERNGQVAQCLRGVDVSALAAPLDWKRAVEHLAGFMPNREVAGHRLTIRSLDVWFW